MILKSTDIEIPEDNPFLNDSLNRQDSAEALTEFVLSANESLVICIDAPWGQGKTTFLRMWAQSLKNKKVPTIYFSAWENDFSDDALVSLIGEIGSSLAEISKTGDESKAKEYFEKAKTVGVALLKKSLPVAAKIATAGALDLDKVTEQALAALAESLAKEQIDRYENSKKSIQHFRDALHAFALRITDEEDPKPLVFIIDELDRCRPSYSIEILEKAKHFFNAQNMVFVLGADKGQLGSSIRSIYGEGLNVNGYLRRFIDFDYLLPTPEKGKFVKVLFVKHAFKDYFAQKQTRDAHYEHEQALAMFAELFGLYDLTLREQEHCCSLLSLAIKTTPNDYKLYPLLLCFLIVLKVKMPDRYINFIAGSASAVDLLNEIRSTPGGVQLLDSNYGIALEAFLATCKMRRHDLGDAMAPYAAITESTEASDDFKYRAQRIIEIAKDFSFHGGAGALPYLAKKIEIIGNFES